MKLQIFFRIILLIVFSKQDKFDFFSRKTIGEKEKFNGLFFKIDGDSESNVYIPKNGFFIKIVIGDKAIEDPENDWDNSSEQREKERILNSYGSFGHTFIAKKETDKDN